MMLDHRLIYQKLKLRILEAGLRCTFATWVHVIVSAGFRCERIKYITWVGAAGWGDSERVIHKNEY